MPHRKRAIERHMRMLAGDRSNLLWLFDYWRSCSAKLRQYLWAHREPDVDRARRLIEILSPAQILTILRYLVEDYWGHYIGWPDLLLHRNEEILFLEVKSSCDRLSQAQRSWIAGNYGRLHLPLKLVKLHRATSKMPRSALTAS
jgi:VRR-NUC domain